ncbi:hypothetical protein KAZ66_00505 [Candidatus Woesebacteria bacterium]|nr:hypothetical protein [Candidatus Woesebacteria bacterium]
MQLPGLSDDRGSRPQKILFDMCCDIYGKHNVIWELVIPELNQRFDIFIRTLGVAIEYDGAQHTQYVQHFHKDEVGFIASIKRDNKKSEWATVHGIVIVRFDISNMPAETSVLRSIITDSLIETDYSFSSFDVVPNPIHLAAKNYRKEQYKEMKKRLR